MKYDFLIVGAGYSGCILAERIASQLDKKVLIVDRRPHIAGNAYDYVDEHGVLVHKYGPHIFHTNSQKVFEYLSGFTDWHFYEHKVLAEIEGRLAPVPFNLNSLDILFPKEFAQKMTKLLVEQYGMEKKVPILEMQKTNNPDLKFLADYIYKNVFYGYTVKQWDLKPDELDASVTSRVPVFISRDDRYFQDTYQFIPKDGYTEMFKRIIAHPNITVKLNTEFNNAGYEFDKLIYTGPIDAYFEYKFGKLPYRSLRFELKSYNKQYFQPTTQVNFPNQHDYTRISEYKYILDQKLDATTVAYEYPQAYVHGDNEPYYPIPRQENRDLFNQYLEEAKKEKNVYFVGRLADYVYYNMDQVVARALTVFEKEIS